MRVFPAPLILLVFSCFFVSNGYAELYFAPEFISSDPQMVADLARFEKEGTQLPANYPVDIYLNGKFSASRSLRFVDAGMDVAANKTTRDIRDNTGLMACLTKPMLEKFGINFHPFPQLNLAPDDQCISPGKFIPEAFTRFNFQQMRLDISIPQAAMANNARGYIPPERWDEGINALLLSYSFSGNTSHSLYGGSSSHYLNLNSGFNFGPWRLRDYRTWNDYNSRYYRYQKWQHIKTYIERAIIPLRSNLIMGDSATSGDIFDSLGFRGVQIETDDNMYPDSQRGFAPVVRGTARTNARVSIMQNGYTIYQTFVSPGAFAINDLYAVSSSGDLKVMITEADGSVQTFTVPYSSVPVLKREGRLKYTLTAGRYQASSDAYRSPDFAQGTLIWGLPHNITLYGGSQYSKNYLSGLIGGGLNLGMLGALSADITHASSDLADGSHHNGQSLRFLYARSLNTLGTAFQLTGYRYSTEGFHTLNETVLKGMRGRYSDIDSSGRPVQRPYIDYYNLYNNKRAKVQANISQRIGDIGSIYLSGVHQTYWNKSGASDSLQAGFNSSVGSVNYSLMYSYNRESSEPASNNALFLSLSVPLNALFPDSSESHRHTSYATYSASQDNDGNISHQAGLSGTVLDDDNLSWNVSQGYTPHDGNSGSLSANYQGGYGNSNLGYSYSNNYRQVSYGISGGAILHRDGLTLGQSVGETNILIAAPGVSDVEVENEIAIRTDWRGYAIKPYASVYRENRVALNASSLDDYTEIDDPVTQVVPTRGAVVRAPFKGASGKRVLMTLKHNGKLLPFGTIVTVGERGGIVGDIGQVYLSGLQDEGKLYAKWGSDAQSQCTVHYHLPMKNSNSPIIKTDENCS